MKTPTVKTCDGYWSKLVKELADNKCEKCHRTGYLNSHHIFSRSNRTVRWIEKNGVCLCAGCHCLCNDSAHKAPLEFAEWIKKKRGEKWYNDLRLTANMVQKQDLILTSMYLREKLKQLNK